MNKKIEGNILSFEVSDKYLLIEGNYQDRYIFKIDSIASISSFWENTKDQDNALYHQQGIYINDGTIRLKIRMFDAFPSDGVSLYNDPQAKEARRSILNDMNTLFKIIEK